MQAFQVNAIELNWSRMHCSSSAQIASLLSVRDWQVRNENARIADQRALDNRLNDLEANQHHLANILSTLGQRCPFLRGQFR